MKKLMTVFITVCIVATMVFVGVGCTTTAAETTAAETTAAEGEPYEIAVVFKLEGTEWGDNIRKGCAEFSAEYGVNSYMIAADTADSAKQVSLIEDLIVRGVDAMCVIPNDPMAVENVLQKARDAGIVVVVHESATQKNMDYAVEAFKDIEYGRHIMDYMAEWMGEEGKWVAMVGWLTSVSHNLWVDGAEMQAKEKYPNLVEVSDRLEGEENQQVMYERCQEVLTAHPDLKAIMGTAMMVVPAASQAIEEKGLIGKTAAFGTCLPSVAYDGLISGACQKISFWSPVDVGYVVSRVCYEILEGNQITEGMDLGRPGYENITITKNEFGFPVIYGSAWVDVTKDNMDEYDL